MPDAVAICDIVNYHAERGRMLHTHLERVYDTLRNFLVAEEDGEVLGCVAIDIAWTDLAEVRSLAVRPGLVGKGIGRALVEASIADARQLGLRRLFALTYEKGFFERCGFHVVDKDRLPSKVWSDCVLCPKRKCCDEIAMVMDLHGPAPGPSPTP